MGELNWPEAFVIVSCVFAFAFVCWVVVKGGGND